MLVSFLAAAGRMWHVPGLIYRVRTEMTAKGDGQTPQLYYDSFVSALRAYDSSIIIGAAPECQYGNGTNPLEGLVSGASAASLDYLLFVFASSFQDPGFFH